MNKRARGSFYMDDRQSRPLNIEANEKFSDLGFRLVHDDADRVNRGNSWYYDPQGASLAVCGSNDSGRRGAPLGFRLVREGT